MITEKDVRHVARLARLSLSAEEVKTYQGQLGRILDHIAELERLDLGSVEPTAHILELSTEGCPEEVPPPGSVGGRPNALRPDEPKPFAGAADILANAPSREGPYFKVPKVLGAALLAVGLLGSRAACKEPSPQALETLRNGIAAYEAARFDDAVELLGKALELRPGWKTASGFRAICRWTTGEVAAAQADAKVALKLQPNSPESFVARGFALFVLRQFDLAVEDFEKAAGINAGYVLKCVGLTCTVRRKLSGPVGNGRYALAFFGLGSVFSQCNLPKDALPHLNEAVKLAPEAAVIRVVRGTVREKLKNFRGAVEDYDAALKAAPDFEFAHLYRGRAYREIRDFERSQEDLTTFLKRNPDHEEALYLRSNVLYQLAEYAATIQDLDRLIELNPRHGLAYANRGLARIQTGEKLGALADLTKAKGMLPDRAAAIEEQIQGLRAEKPPELPVFDEGPSGVAADALLPGEEIEKPQEGKDKAERKRRRTNASDEEAPEPPEKTAPEAPGEETSPGAEEEPLRIR